MGRRSRPDIGGRGAAAAAGAGALAAAAGAALWWRRNPSPCPYAQRLWVELPHPSITRARLLEVLAPATGERVLEVGPGTGYYTLGVARPLRRARAARHRRRLAADARAHVRASARSRSCGHRRARSRRRARAFPPRRVPPRRDLRRRLL